MFHRPLQKPALDGKFCGTRNVVLLHFDGSLPLHVFAYPMRCSPDIAWEKKSVGPNISGRMKFDPRALNARFRFRDLGEFEREFRARFGS